jgi:hypothetical protein
VVRLRRRLAVVLVVALAGAGCARDTASSDTLAPLPVPEVVETTAPPPPTTVPATIATTTTTLPEQPVGDWDGALFDIGEIRSDGESDGFRTIRFDRFSYQDPDVGLVDAAGLRAEPLPAWWQESPFENNRDDVRRFVLSPTVELLRLAEDDEDVACADPPPPTPPEARWEGVDISFLGTRAARRSVAILTYAPSGPVIRIRFTRGCD